MQFDRKKYVSHVFTHPGFAPQLIENLHGTFDKYKEVRADRPEIADKHMRLSTELAFAKNTQEYLLTDPALVVIDRISVTRKFDLSLLRRTNEKRLYTFWVDNMIGYRVLWSPTEIVTIGVRRHKNNDFFRPYQEYYSVSHILDLEAQGVMEHSEEDEFSIIKWTLQTLLFLELTDPTFLYLAANKKFSTRPLGYTSNNPTGLTIVTSKWNVHIIRTEGFGVRGHIRVYRNRVDGEPKAIWIKPFQKKGYKRLAKT